MTRKPHQPIAEFEADDIEKHKLLAALSYLAPLFALPLLLCPESGFAKFHANQGIVFFLIFVAVYFLLVLIPFIGWALTIPLSLTGMALVVLGIVTALSGKAKPLPWIGHIQLL